MKDLIKNFRKCFDGYELAYGQHGNLKKTDSGKVNGEARTIIKDLDDSVIEKHLNGKGSSLGIVPLKKNLTVKFGAIDIDGKHPTNPRNHTLEEMEEKIKKLKLPLVPCQSKSGDIHLYCFTKKEIPSSTMIKRLKEWASLLGYGNCEIFPKQTTRVNENDIGNWINLPYYDYKKTVRFAINKKKKLLLENFYKFVEAIRVSPEEMEDFKMENVDESFNDAPPCLQTLATLGVEEGSRNNGLYNFAVYYKKKYPDEFEDKIMEANVKLFSPMLRRSEVEAIIKSVNRKDFFYKCEEYPICQFCNKTECFSRKFGVGNKTSSGEISFENLTKYEGEDSSRWYAEMQGVRIQLSTDELLNQKLLQRKLLDTTNKIFQPMKAGKWISVVDNLLKTCQTFKDPEDASKKGQFKAYLERFLTDSTPGTKRSDLMLSYNSYLDEDKKLIYFLSPNLFSYLKGKRYNFVEQEVWHWIKEMGGDTKKMRVSKTKIIHCWYMKAPDFYTPDDELFN